MTMNLLIIAPCLLSPFYVYRGPKEKEYETARLLREFIGGLGEGWQVLAYPCPEFEVMGWPRPPMGREDFEGLGMRERARKTADFIERVLAEEKPERVVFLGVRGSPTCGAFHTTSNQKPLGPGLAVEFSRMDKGERLLRSREIIEGFGFEVKEGPGLLFEELIKRFPDAEFLEFDKDDIRGSMERTERALKGDKNRARNNQ